MNKAFTDFKESEFEKVASGDSSTLTSFLSLLHLLLHHGEHNPVSVCVCLYEFMYKCLCTVFMYECVCVGILEPESSVCQMMWQQWTRQCEAPFFILPKAFPLDNSVCMYVCIPASVSACISQKWN